MFTVTGPAFTFNNPIAGKVFLKFSLCIASSRKAFSTAHILIVTHAQARIKTVPSSASFSTVEFEDTMLFRGINAIPVVVDP